MILVLSRPISYWVRPAVLCTPMKALIFSSESCTELGSSWVGPRTSVWKNLRALSRRSSVVERPK